MILLLSQCTSVEELLQQGEVVKSDIRQQIEFEYTNRLLFVDVQINGMPRRFIIDSGAPTVISQPLREELQLKRLKSTHVSDSQNNRSKLEFVRLESLALGGVEVANSTALVTDLSLFHCLGIDGLLGANVMSHFNWEVDYQKENIRLYQKDGTERPEASYEIAIPFTTKAQGTPDLEIDIPGLLSASGVTLDLGATGGISIHKTDELKIKRDTNLTFSYGRTSKGIYGANTDTTFFFLVDSLAIGSAPFEQALITTYNTSNKIGNRFWENYKLFISWSNNRLYLNPQDVRPPQLPKTLLKIGYEDGAVRVLTIFQNLALSNKNIEPGDEVIQANEMDTEEISLDDYCALRGSGWEEVQLKIRKKESEEIIEINFNRDEMEW